MLSFQLVKNTSDGGCFSVRQLEDQLLSTVSLGQCQQYRFRFGLSDDQVHFPVPALRALPYVRGPVLNAG